MRNAGVVVGAIQQVIIDALARVAAQLSSSG
jgi:hypothetical protein